MNTDIDMSTINVSTYVLTSNDVIVTCITAREII